MTDKFQKDSYDYNIQLLFQLTLLTASLLTEDSEKEAWTSPDVLRLKIV